MKIEKHSINKRWFYYIDYKTNIKHGLEFDCYLTRKFGYYYQDKRKGFWLDKNKI
jgi:hypothetical protein